MPTRRALLGSAAAWLAGAPLAAHALDAPVGPVVLSIVGRLRTPNRGASADFDMAMLERLPAGGFSTATPWYAQPRRFSGPLLRDVLSAAGAQGTTLRARALNDYWIDLPVDDAQRHDPIIATRLDGKPMAVRDKGPLFLIYPFDARPELRTSVYYSRSAWQLRTIEVR